MAHCSRSSKVIPLDGELSTTFQNVLPTLYVYGWVHRERVRSWIKFRRQSEKRRYEKRFVTRKVESSRCCKTNHGQRRKPPFYQFECLLKAVFSQGSGYYCKLLQDQLFNEAVEQPISNYWKPRLSRLDVIGYRSWHNEWLRCESALCPGSATVKLHQAKNDWCESKSLYWHETQLTRSFAVQGVF
jgi:hypothetical protein